jgi:hypothetical protein
MSDTEYQLIKIFVKARQDFFATSVDYVKLTFYDIRQNKTVYKKLKK